MEPTTQKSYALPTSLALLIGASAGLTAGFYFAGKGAKLRTEIGNTVDDLELQGRQTFNRAKSAASQMANNAIDTGESRAHDAIDKTIEVVNSAGPKSHQTVADAAESLRVGARA